MSRPFYLLASLFTLGLAALPLIPHQPKPHEIVHFSPAKMIAPPPAPGKPVESELIAEVVPTPTPTPIPTATPILDFYSGTKYDWLVAAGIPQGDWPWVDYIIAHESSWNPQAQNSSSGAGGLPQALPYSKTGCAWGDPICQLQWADNYAKSRYGSWYGAYLFWINNHWW